LVLEGVLFLVLGRYMRILFAVERPPFDNLPFRFTMIFGWFDIWLSKKFFLLLL